MELLDDQFRRYLLKTAWAMGGNQDAEDWVQRAMLAVWQAQQDGRFAAGRDPVPFAVQHAKYSMLEQRRNQAIAARRRHEVPVEDLPVFAPPVEDDTINALVVHMHILPVLRQLPYGHLLILVAQGHRQHDMARAAGIPEVTLRTRVHRARAAARRLLRGVM